MKVMSKCESKRAWGAIGGVDEARRRLMTNDGKLIGLVSNKEGGTDKMIG